jgi:hypothetical protein
MGNRSSAAADAGVLQVSSARAAEIHPDVAALARLPASRPLVSAANSGGGGRAASQQSAVQSPPPRAQVSSNSSSSPSLPRSTETEAASTASAADAAAAHTALTLRLDPACVQALHDRVRSHLATSVDGILVSQHEMNYRVRALQTQSQAVVTECAAVAADIDAFSAQLDARTND